MYMKPNKLKFSKEEFESVVKQSKSVRDICRSYKKPINGYYNKLFNKWIKTFSCDTSHFTRNLFLETCCHCGNVFEITQKKRGKRKFCSLKCANQKIRGAALPKNIEDLYGEAKHRRICFRYHKKECVICGEKIIVTVHHYNEDHDDNRPENLVPMCPTHHVYLHSKIGKPLIIEKVNLYIKQFMEARAK